ncbi:MAG: hypothetical protein S4CHLAM2_05700 [Chlamydiales bacterium]|nr:hypothetical protein [Chlamydiales bacterium]
MSDAFKIFVSRLRDGQKESIEESFSPAFLDIHEQELAFSVPVVVQGEAELAQDTLVLRLNIETEATLPCAICNQDVQVKLEIADSCYPVPVAEIKGDVFNLKGVLREAILLELPYRAECKQGKCPEREVLSKYFSRS